jgi:UrcA family protein
MTKIPLVVAAIALALPTVPTVAEERTVSYADLNLASPEGQKALERRIANALEEVCEVPKVRTGTRLKSRSAQRCVDEASRNAKEQVAVILEQKGLGG